jgi:hypothetical protein
MTVFDGPLTDLAATGARTPGVSTGWVPSAGEARTYRLTVEVSDNDRLQRSSGSATLTWLRGRTSEVNTPPTHDSP